MMTKHTLILTLPAALTLALAMPACDAPETTDELLLADEGELADEVELADDESPALVANDGDEPQAVLACDPDLEAAVGGLYYPVGWTCPQAIANAESTFGSWHYRNACNQQVGSDIAEPVDGAEVTSCQLDPSGQILVTVDLCCAEPPAPACDPDLAASVGGLYYPAGWTCPQAIANAESSFGSWHYRNACNQQVGSDIADPVGDATVTSCQLDPSGQTLVTVDLCCAEPPVSSCDPAHEAGVGGIYYPGWTCADAIANAESSFGSYHYRNACHQQTGSNIATPVQDASVTECHIESGSAVVTVDLCCA